MLHLNCVLLDVPLASGDELAQEGGRRKEGRKDGRTEGWKDGRTEGRKDGRTDGRTERRTDGTTEGRKEGRKGRSSELHLCYNLWNITWQAGINLANIAIYFRQ